MTATLAGLTGLLQRLFFDLAEAAAEHAHLIQRRRQLTAPAFAQGLVFAWMQHPDASTEQLASAVTAAGSPISGPGLCQRFDQPASNFLRALLQPAVTAALGAANPALAPLLDRCNGVHLLDATQLLLPGCLAGLWPSAGGDNPHAGIKRMALLEFCSGQLGLELKAASDGDTTFAAARRPLPAGALRLADLGFFDLDLLLGYHLNGVYHVTRAQPHTTLTAGGRRCRLWRYLRDSRGPRLELEAQLGQQGELPCRMLAWRCPAEVAAGRRRGAREQARKRGRTPGERASAACDWTVLFTNAPREKLSADEAWVVYRVRWQVGLLFKRWKPLARLGHSVGHKAQRVLCEAYAKLLGVLLRSWLLLLAGGGWPRRSGWKCFQELGSWAQALLLALGDSGALLRLLARLREVLRKKGGVAARKKKPATFQTLEHPQENGPQASPHEPDSQPNRSSLP